jgi:hypothetical protein
MERMQELLNRPAITVPALLGMLVAVIELAKTGAAAT